MYKISFCISKKQEKSLTRNLASAGITSYFIENTGNINMLHVFTESTVLPGVLDGLVPLSVSVVNESTWMHAWAENFTGHELTDNLYAAAAGSPLPGKEYTHIITIDPRDSFGDGHHPTTRLCACLLQDYLLEQANPWNLAMIDVGTGSGLLAIEAYILGIRMIELFDIDELSVKMVEKNLQLNGITGLKPFVGDIYNFSFNKKYDVVTANLLTGLLEDNISSLAGALAMGGVMIISGISAKWTSLARRLIMQNNLIILKHKKLEGWNGFMLHKAE
ncbi:MAG TPA: 50S ribosomal protein L11 methyltransferase [Spirochaetota bacterium]|nr:50S ribosomal protein L11 methyltransferase [Spirochaetota bacterium]